MSDNTTNTTATTPASALRSDQAEIEIPAGAEQSLRAQVERSQQQVLELESAMEGMLRDHDMIQEDLDQTRTLIGGVRADLRQALRAISRIEKGTFGQCVGCGNPISPTRLERSPKPSAAAPAPDPISSVWSA